MIADLQLIETHVRAVLATSPIGKQITSVQLEAADEDGREFVRVVFQVADLDDVSDADLTALMESIEDRVAGIDERFPSVRFADAA